MASAEGQTSAAPSTSEATGSAIPNAAAIAASVSASVAAGGAENNTTDPSGAEAIANRLPAPKLFVVSV